jgi:hypothetical protein
MELVGQSVAGFGKISLSAIATEEIGVTSPC